MKKQPAFCHASRHACTCCPAVRRRDFLSATGLAALGATSMAAPFGVEASETPTPPSGKPRIRAAFVGQAVERYFMGWPGAAYDIKARQAEYTEVLNQAAKRLDVELDLSPDPIADPDAISALAAECTKQPPDGVLLLSLCLNTSWTKIIPFIKQRPADLPTIVYSPMGTSFLNQVQQACKEAEGTRTFIASTPSVEWLAFALQMLNTYCQMKRTRICVVQTKDPRDIHLDNVGVTLHHIHYNRFSEEYAKVETDDEVRAMADSYARTAEETIEPSPGCATM